MILYKKDSKGRVRSWRLEKSEGSYRTISGLVDGAKVTSEWTYVERKNIGKKNETSLSQQVDLECRQKVNLKLRAGWSDDRISLDKFKFSPMLAKSFPDADKFEKWSTNNAGPYFIQPKFDGIRSYYNIDGLFSRSGKKFSSCPHIESEAKLLIEMHPDIYIDGELYNHEYKEDFNKIVSLVKRENADADIRDLHKIEFHVFDCFFKDQPELSFGERWLKISYLINSNKFNFILQSPTKRLGDITPECASLNMQEYISYGYEGLMIRCSNLPYEMRRSSSLWKVKSFEDAEFKLLDVHEGLGNWSGCAKSITVELEDNRRCDAGISGARDFCKHLIENKDIYIGGDVTVKFQGRTPDGMLRFPIAKIIRKGERLL